MVTVPSESLLTSSMKKAVALETSSTSGKASIRSIVIASSFSSIIAVGVGSAAAGTGVAVGSGSSSPHAMAKTPRAAISAIATRYLLTLMVPP